MNNYEAMIIIKPDLSEEEKKTLFNQISDVLIKNEGKVLQVSIWAEKKKFYFPIKKCREGLYYLVNFSANAGLIGEIRQAYKLNENILRTMITRTE